MARASAGKSRRWDRWRLPGICWPRHAGKMPAPLWVIADEDSSAGFSVHARVVTGIVGDGSPQGTRIVYNDPASGAEEDETLKAFADKLNQLSDGALSVFGGVSPFVLAL